ncbi:MAG: hypothetical protein ACYSW3_18765 [Planctomycetota bacterium]|jgi:hypothetical protein
MLKKRSFTLFTSSLSLLFVLPLALVIGATNQVRKGEMAGYLLVPNERVEKTYNAGFSLYVAAWPLLKEYPGNRFQTGLFGTWMHAQYDSRPSERLYSDIEGGLGWWRDTRFATETPKFIMGGVALNFSAWANGPGAGKGRDWDKPRGKYGVAQLSPWVLWPPDGLNLKQGTCGELFGYGYLPLPLTEPKSTTAGKNVPTGNNCWTLFLNARNFKGPVAFFTPYFFSRVTVDKPDIAGMFLDSRPSNPNRALQMETQYVPAVQAVDDKGDTYARIAPTSFPRRAPSIPVGLLCTPSPEEAGQHGGYISRELQEKRKSLSPGALLPPPSRLIRLPLDTGGTTNWLREKTPKMANWPRSPNTIA